MLIWIKAKWKFYGDVFRGNGPIKIQFPSVGNQIELWVLKVEFGRKTQTNLWV